MNKKEINKIALIFLLLLVISLIIYGFNAKNLNKNNNFLGVDFKDETDSVKDTTTISADVSEEEGVSVLTPSGMIVASAIDLITGEAVSEIEKVEFKIDGIIIETKTSAPYSIQWDTTKFSNGEHEITAVVTYKSGNKESSSPVKVTVDNAVVVSDSSPSPSPSPTTTTGNTYYVATTGSDSNSCVTARNINTPKLTIAAGMGCLTAAGDTLYIRGGTYTGQDISSSDMGINGGTSWSNKILISGYPGENVIVIGSLGIKHGPPGYDPAGPKRQYIEIAKGASGSFVISGGGVIIGGLGLTNHIRLNGLEIKDSSLSGVYLYDSYHEIINSKIHDNGYNIYRPGEPQRGHGIYVSSSYLTDESSYNLIENNDIYNNGRFGVHLNSEGTLAVSHNIVRNNKIHDNGVLTEFSNYELLLGDGIGNIAYNNLIYGGQSGVFINGEQTLFYNNIIYGMSAKGIGFDQYSRNAQVKNNIIMNSGGYALDVLVPNANHFPVIQHNVFFGNGYGNALNTALLDNPTISNNINLDPKFVSTTFGSENFRLQTGSPAIDKGVNLGSPYNVDFDGKTRPIGSAYDIGAYEYGTITNPISITTGVKAFPTAEGYAENTVGGRGSRVIKVTNLKDSGLGSFRQAVQESTGPRIVVFTVSGTISLLSPILIWEDASYLTIAGQTSPGGVQLKNFGIQIDHGAHDIIIRHLRVRHGIELDGFPPYANGCGCGIPIEIWKSDTRPVYNIIIDHTDMYWGVADNFGLSGAVTDITVQWSIFAEAGTKGHFYSETGYFASGHSMNVLIDAGGGTRINLHHNLLAQSNNRNPHIQRGMVDFRNNFIYNWRDFAWGLSINGYNSGQAIAVNFVGNVYKKGFAPSLWSPSQDSSPDFRYILTVGAKAGDLGINPKTKVYYKQNMADDSVAPEDWDTLPPMEYYTNLDVEDALRASYESVTPVMPEPVVMYTNPVNLWATIKDTVGAYKPSRDALDTRIVYETENRAGVWGPGADGNTYLWPTLTGGSAPTDSDQDGMPDSWETAHGLNPNDINDGAKVSSNEYTYVENYLNELAGDIVPAFT